MSTHPRGLRRLRTLAAAAAVAATITTLASACSWPPDDTPSTPPTTSTIWAQTTFTSAGQWCTADNVVWSANPIAVNPGPGKSTPYSETRNYGRFLAATGGTCGLSHTYPNLQPGKWRLTVDAGTASGICEATLAAGNVRVDFTSTGCSVQP